MSNSNINNEISAESKTSFITVSSMLSSMEICSDPQKDKEEINLNSSHKNFTTIINCDLNNPPKKISLDPSSIKNESLISISMSQEDDNKNLNLKKNNISNDKFQDLPLQFSNSEKRSKNVIPHLVVEDKGEKRD
jgi:hypothetical protein